MQEKGVLKCDRSRRGVLTVLAGCMIVILAGYGSWRVGRGEAVWKRGGAFYNLSSALEDISSCYLCGNSDRSLITCFRGMDEIGLLCLNDWQVLNFGLNKDRTDLDGTGYGCTRYGSTETFLYSVYSNPARGMAEMKVSLSRNDQLSTEQLCRILCQNCLKKIEKIQQCQAKTEGQEDAVRFCLIDFRTSELYPVLDLEFRYFIRDYWIEIGQEENELEIEAFYLPEQRKEETAGKGKRVTG